MQSTADAIFAAALQLTEDERLTLAAQLLETISEEAGGSSLDDPDLIEELRRRSADLEGTVPWSQLRDEL